MKANRQRGRRKPTKGSRAKSKKKLSDLLTTANQLAAEGNTKAAVEIFREMLGTDSSSFAALVNLGNALKQLGQLPEAVGCYMKALEVRPNAIEALANLGTLYQDAGDATRAMNCFEDALRVDPKAAPLHNNLAGLLKDRGMIEGAISHYRKALAINPSFTMASSNLLLTMNYAEQGTEGACYEEARRWAESNADSLLPQPGSHRNDRSPQRRLKVGYVSRDFWTHSVSYFVEPVLAAHDRGAFEVICYADGTRRDDVTSRLRNLSDHWREVSALHDEQLASLIRDDTIDILVDLSGHSAGNRMGVFARAPAPVQVSYIGYPNTSGLKTIGYRITDAWADPPDTNDACYTEELVRLSQGFLCYRPMDESPAVGAAPFERNGHVTFGSFNNLAKLSDVTVANWSAVLESIPDAKLIIKSLQLSDAGTCSFVQERFARCGIDSGRIELFGKIPSNLEHLRLYGAIDIGLDTYPYNGTTTSCEALWMGVPVVTLAGRQHASRVGVSLLSSLGLEELVASSADQFVEKAAQLARNLDRLRGLRIGLRARMRQAPLTDGAKITASLEQAFRDMWRRWCAQGA